MHPVIRGIFAVIGVVALLFALAASTLTLRYMNWWILGVERQELFFGGYLFITYSAAAVGVAAIVPTETVVGYVSGGGYALAGFMGLLFLMALLTPGQIYQTLVWALVGGVFAVFSVVLHFGGIALIRTFGPGDNEPAEA